MMAKPMKTLELHYPMIQFLIIGDILHWIKISFGFNLIIKYEKVLLLRMFP